MVPTNQQLMNGIGQFIPEALSLHLQVIHFCNVKSQKLKTIQPKPFVMRKVSFYLFAVLAVFTIATSCKKDKPEPESTEENIAGVYKITGLQVQAGNSGKVDYFDRMNECQKNDTWGFQENGTFLFGGAATADCQDGDFSGTWNLNDKTLTITTDQASTTYHLDSFNGHTMVLSTAATVNDEPGTFYFTYTKQ
jgi:hypothetical protein